MGKSRAPPAGFALPSLQQIGTATASLQTPLNLALHLSLTHEKHPEIHELLHLCTYHQHWGPTRMCVMHFSVISLHQRLPKHLSHSIICQIFRRQLLWHFFQTTNPRWNITMQSHVSPDGAQTTISGSMFNKAKELLLSTPSRQNSTITNTQTVEIVDAFKCSQNNSGQ